MISLLILSLLAAPTAAVAAPAPAAPSPSPQKATPAVATAPAVAPSPARAERPRAEAELAGLASGALEVRTVAADAKTPVSLGVWPARPWQGALLVVDVAADEAIRSATGSFLGRDLIWHRLDERTWRGMGPVPDDAPVGDSRLQVQVHTARGKFSRSASLEILPLEWDHDELRVDSKYTQLSREAQAQIKEDRATLAAMWRKGSSKEALFGTGFVIPREDRTTAPYGTRRVFNGATKSVHRGWDIGGPVGSEIHAPADGVVTYARDMYYSGNTLFVDHGGGLYTGYFHMDSFAVEPGDRVEAGQLLGTVGATGRVTGPHLHWAAKIGGHYIHPASLLLLDFGRRLAEPPAETQPAAVPATVTAGG